MEICGHTNNLDHEVPKIPMYTGDQAVITFEYMLCSTLHFFHTPYYFPLLGGCYVYCVLINVLNLLHGCEECYIQL